MVSSSVVDPCSIVRTPENRQNRRATAIYIQTSKLAFVPLQRGMCALFLTEPNMYTHIGSGCCRHAFYAREFFSLPILCWLSLHHKTRAREQTCFLSAIKICSCSEEGRKLSHNSSSEEAKNPWFIEDFQKKQCKYFLCRSLNEGNSIRNVIVCTNSKNWRKFTWKISIRSARQLQQRQTAANPFDKQMINFRLPS